MNKFIRDLLVFYAVLSVVIIGAVYLISNVSKAETDKTIDIRKHELIKSELVKKEDIKVEVEEVEEKEPEKKEVEEKEDKKINSELYEITAYTAGPESTGKSPGHPAYGITTSGDKVKENYTIAADWNVLPEGTRVKIEGMGEYVVKDTGGNIKGNRIDIYMEDEGKAMEFGRQTLEVTILGGE